jgi:hypothetical protein
MRQQHRPVTLLISSFLLPCLFLAPRAAQTTPSPRRRRPHRRTRQSSRCTFNPQSISLFLSDIVTVTTTMTVLPTLPVLLAPNSLPLLTPNHRSYPINPIHQDPPMSLPWILNKSTMLMGVDVSHPDPGNQGDSMAAVVSRAHYLLNFSLLHTAPLTAPIDTSLLPSSSSLLHISLALRSAL